VNVVISNATEYLTIAHAWMTISFTLPTSTITLRPRRLTRLPSLEERRPIDISHHFTISQREGKPLAFDLHGLCCSSSAIQLGPIRPRLARRSSMMVEGTT
jgi:hypothetical protein